jgi:hypothetical protein
MAAVAEDILEEGCLFEGKGSFLEELFGRLFQKALFAKGE